MATPAPDATDSSDRSKKPDPQHKDLAQQVDMRDAAGARTTDTAGKALPTLEISGHPQVSATTKLDQAAVQTAADQLKDAVNQKRLYVMDNPDVQKIQNILGPLNAADRAAIEKAYGNNPPLREALKEHLSEVDFRKAEALLNTRDGRTNDAGQVMVALADMKSNQANGNVELRAALSTLNSQQLKQLDADLRHDYPDLAGQGGLDQVLKSADLQQSTKDMMPALLAGSDKRTAAQIVDAAKATVKDGDLRAFGEVVNGDSPAAIEARKALNTNEFRDQLQKAFPNQQALINASMADNGGIYLFGPSPSEQILNSMTRDQKTDQAVLDFLNEGHPSLATITANDTNSWLFSNKENVELAAKNASPQERQQYSQGMQLSESGQPPKTDADKAALAYYQKIHDAFTSGGNPREASIWEDNLLHGHDTILSQMARTHNDGYFASNPKQPLMAAAENLSQSDWNLLRDKKTGPAFMDEIQKSLNTYSPENAAQIMDMLKKKVDFDNPKATYADSTNVHRTLAQTIEDNKGSAFLGFGTSYNGANISEAFANLSPAESKAYADPKSAERKTLDDFVANNLSGPQQMRAQELLKQVADTGAPPKPNELDTLLKDKIAGADDQHLITDATALLQDKATRDRLNQPFDKLSPQDQQLKQLIVDSVGSASGFPLDAQYDQQMQSNPYTKALFQDGKLQPAQKLNMGYKATDMMGEIAAAPADQRKEAEQYLTADQTKIVEAAAGQGGKLDLADRMRQFVTTDGDKEPSQFNADLAKLSNDDKQKLISEYNKKYGGDLGADFLAKVKPTEQSHYRDALTPAAVDGRQSFYDHVNSMLKSESGFSADGSQLTMEKAVAQDQEMLSKYQSVYKTLKPEQQAALDKYFSQAADQYKDSKEKLADVITNATIAATALAAGAVIEVGTLGLGTPAVVGLAVATGAAIRVGGSAAIEGNDFDSSAGNVAKEAVIGAGLTGMNLLGGKILQGVGAVASRVSEAVVGDVVGSASLDSAAQSTLRAGLQKMIASGGNQLDDSALGALVDKTIAAGGSGATRDELMSSIRAAVSAHYDTIQGEVASEIANRTFGQAAIDTAKLTGKSALVGSGISAGATTLEEGLNGGVRAQDVLDSALIGGGIGAAIPIGISGLRAAGKVLDAGTSAATEALAPAGDVATPSAGQRAPEIRVAPSEVSPEPVSGTDQTVTATTGDAAAAARAPEADVVPTEQPKLVAEQPAADVVPAEQPKLVAEQPAADVVPAEQPKLVAEQPAPDVVPAEQPKLVAEQPAPDVVPAEQPKLVAEQPAADVVPAEQPKLVAEQPAADVAPAEQPKLVAEQPAADVVPAEQPAHDPDLAVKATEETPAVKPTEESAAVKPIEDPAAVKPTEDPAAVKPTEETPVVRAREEEVPAVPKTEIPAVEAAVVAPAATVAAEVHRDATDTPPPPAEAAPKTVPYTVKKGDNLWTISEHSLKSEGNAHPSPQEIWSRVENIIEANKKQYPDLHSHPNLILPDMALALPLNDHQVPHITPSPVARTAAHHRAPQPRKSRRRY